MLRERQPFALRGVNFMVPVGLSIRVHHIERHLEVPVMLWARFVPAPASETKFAAGRSEPSPRNFTKCAPTRRCLLHEASSWILVCWYRLLVLHKSQKSRKQASMRPREDRGTVTRESALFGSRQRNESTNAIRKETRRVSSRTRGNFDLLSRFLCRLSLRCHDFQKAVLVIGRDLFDVHRRRQLNSS